MSYTNPNGWSKPRCTLGIPPSVPTFGNDGLGAGTGDWTPADNVTDTDIKRIETNIKGLHTLLCQSGTVDILVKTPYFSAQVAATLNWTRINNIVFLSFPEILTPASTNNNELQIHPATIWPAEILPDSRIYATCIFIKNTTHGVNYRLRPGTMYLPIVNTDTILCLITKYSPANDTDGVFIKGNLSADAQQGFSDALGGGYKGIPAQTISYMTDSPSPPAYVSTTSTTPVPTTSTTTPVPTTSTTTPVPTTSTTTPVPVTTSTTPVPTTSTTPVPITTSTTSAP